MHGYLRHLANFAEIARSGSMGAAADRLGISVSGLSRSLSILEAHYGFPLLLRSARGVGLTEHGRLVLAEAETIVGAAHRALEVGRGPAALVGTVVFSAPKEVLQLWIVSKLVDILGNHPGLDLTVLASDQVLDSRRQRLDVVLRIGPNDTAKDLMPLLDCPVRPVLVAAPAVARLLALEKMEMLPATFLRFGPFGQNGTLTLPPQTDGTGERKITFVRQAFVSDVAVAIAMAREGAGVVGCLEPSVREDVKAGRLVELFEENRFRPARLRLGLTKGHQTPVAIAFTSALAEGLDAWLADRPQD